MRKKRGIALIAAVMLIVFVSIAVLGTSVFIVSQYRQIDTMEKEERCIYNASAGLNYVLYQYRDSGALTNGTFNIDAENNFTVSTVANGGSGDAASLVVDATGSVLGNNNRRLQGLHIRNSSAAPIVIDRMIVTWSISNRSMSQIRINGSTVWSGSANSSPANVNITNTTIPANTTRNIDLIQFNSSMLKAVITLSFVMTDDSVTDACTVWPAQGSTCVQAASQLTIKSMGKVPGSSQYRSVEATYDTATGNISVYNEIAQTVP